MALDSPDGDVLLTSPFVTFEVCDRVAAAVRTSETRFQWTLATALDPSAVANGYLSVQGLKHLLSVGVDVRHIGRLHAKCFIVGSRAMLGSSNLTEAGLGSTTNPNHELGVELDEEQTKCARQIVCSWASSKVTRVDLDDLLEQSRALSRTGRAESQPLDPGSASRLAEQLLVDARDPKRGLWIKLEYGDPALEGWRHNSMFASPKKGRPGFNPGDLVFICARDTHDCYAVVEVISDPEYKPQDYVELVTQNDLNPGAVDRWPWVNRTKPRLVPDSLLDVKLSELGVKGQGLQNGHVKLKFDQFTAGVRALGRLASD